MGLKDVLASQGPRFALMAMAAAKGGPQGLSALMEGIQQKELMAQQQSRQQMQDTRAEETHRASLDNMQADNDRLQQQQDMEKLNAAIRLIQQATQQQGETATDSVQAENAIKQQATSAAQLYGLPPDQLTGMVPNMSGPISAGQKKRARVTYGDFIKQYGDQAAELEHLTMSSGEFAGKSFAQIREVAEAVPPAKAKPPQSGSFEEYVDAPPERQAAIEGARKRYMQSDDRPLAAQTPNASGLPPRAQARANRLADMFRTDPAVRRTTVIAEGYSFAKGLSDTSKNPADDQALIYAFAKAMDPDSVVREGEYATVQKYAQSWLQSFGFNAQRILTNSEFLTPESRRNLKATIAQKYQAARKQYDNIRKQSVGLINKETGLLDGDERLIDYSTAFPDDAPQSAPSGGGVPTYQEYLQRRQQGGAQ